MGREIERKFLIKESEWAKLDKPGGKHLRQGYLVSDPNKTIRVRTTDDNAWITIKGISVGASRLEYEYQIPLGEGLELLDNFAEAELEKLRYEIHHQDKLWEVDVFLGDNNGLIVAEIELDSEDEKFELPEWVAEEVTQEKKYYNSNLTKHPFKLWKINVQK
ncbi:adenylate cyclase [Pedobacter sp. Leaf41]|jgi:CYTH domain-containing protein|uniref:CYTH domain-containing protein n=1 Tax=Pedobacter sp. Leaf41 TaxID=1736218 RepID=UPI0007034D8A|nr:CYTH domain-containing protein [Pedobacter sp. Leaf41]KQN28565.1 adenylate cyclase [Pedobacter sp. Leaf41]